MSKEALPRITGIYSAFCESVPLFEILQDGFHTPLSETQIAELFRAGRLGRNTPCKAVSKKDWRTIDELFPLLKYHAQWQFGSEPAETSRESRLRRRIVAGIGLATAAATALAMYYYLAGQNPPDRQVAAIDYIPLSDSPPPRPRHPVSSAQSDQRPVFASTTATFSNTNNNPVVVPAEESNSQSYIRSAETMRLAEQSRLEQAQAQQQQRQQAEAAKQRRAREEQKAIGHDHHVPFDNWQTIDVGGESVTLKIHDNDTTSFDVWMNYGVRREVKKEKGITHSGTDETLIYSNGRAALYYVWEISGRINHCLLRVRDA
jgi:hypothetical protein